RHLAAGSPAVSSWTARAKPRLGTDDGSSQHLASGFSPAGTGAVRNAPDRGFCDVRRSLYWGWNFAGVAQRRSCCGMPRAFFPQGVFAGTGYSGVLQVVQAAAGPGVPRFFLAAPNASLAGSSPQTGAVLVGEDSFNYQPIGEDDALDSAGRRATAVS